MALAVTIDVGESKTEQPSPDVAQTRPADRMTVPATRPAPLRARGARSTRPLELGVTAVTGRMPYAAAGPAARTSQASTAPIGATL